MHLFNSGAFFTCHDVLEELWLAEQRPVRLLYQGVLQVAVALYHAERGNEPGARKLLTKAREHLEPFAPACQGLDVAGLLAGIDRGLAALPGGLAELPGAVGKLR